MSENHISRTKIVEIRHLSNYETIFSTDPSEGHMLRLKICAFFALILAKKALFWAVSAGIPGLPIIAGAIIGWSIFILIFPIKSEVHF